MRSVLVITHRIQDAYKEACLALIHPKHQDQEQKYGSLSQEELEAYKVGQHERGSFRFDPTAAGTTIGSYDHAQLYKEGVLSAIYIAPASKTYPSEASNRADKCVALKLTRSSMIEVPPHHALKEERILRRAQHRHIIPLLDSFRIPGGTLVLAFPWVAGDLQILLQQGTLDRGSSKLILRALFSGLAFLHSNGIIHRDIKPSNILIDLDVNSVYLADFGIAWDPSDDASEGESAKITDVGTTSYRPPELLFGNTAYTSSLDLWAAGCVAVEVFRRDHEPLFDCGEGSSELGLIKSIFSTFGTPTTETWPVSRHH